MIITIIFITIILIIIIIFLSLSSSSSSSSSRNCVSTWYRKHLSPLWKEGHLEMMPSCGEADTPWVFGVHATDRTTRYDGIYGTDIMSMNDDYDDDDESDDDDK